MALERQRPQDFPPEFNQVQIRRIGGLKDDLPARMRQAEQQRIHRTVGTQVIEDGVDPRGVRREPGIDLFKKVHPAGDRAPRVGRGEGVARRGLKRAEDVALLPPPIVNLL